MAKIDLNLLTALDALLAEGSVARAARRLGLSASAMSRTLTRLRAATRDPLLVRAGRGMVLTPHASELRERVRELAHDARAVLRPAGASFEPLSLERTFTLRANDGFVEIFAPRLVAAVNSVAPKVRLRFAPKADKDVRALREGPVDVEIGVLGTSGPEIRVQALFHDRFVGVARRSHPLLRAGKITAERYASFNHVVASRRGYPQGPVDEALAHLGLTRTVIAVVPSFRAALAVARATDAVALVSESFFDEARRHEQSTGPMSLKSFALPVRTAGITVSLMWHPRFDTDPAHRWLRSLVLNTCRPPRP